MNTPVVETRRLHKHYGAVHALDGVDLCVQAGELFGLIGHNGAGKTTLFKLLLGLIPASSGEVLVQGRAPRGEAFRQIRRSIGYVPENVVFYDGLSGIETLRFFADLKGVPRSSCAAALDSVGLTQAAQRRVREYSKGMRQRLGIAQALLGKPSLLMLDEPTSGLDPQATREIYRLLADLRNAGVTVILTSHVLAEIQERVDRLAILRNGRIEAIGTVQALREQMNLPLRMDIALAAAHEARVRAMLERLPVADVHRNGDGRMHLECTRAAKMTVLAALAAPGSDVSDINVREPSLEDVFLGYRR